MLGTLPLLTDGPRAASLGSPDKGRNQRDLSRAPPSPGVVLERAVLSSLLWSADPQTAAPCRRAWCLAVCSVPRPARARHRAHAQNVPGVSVKASQALKLTRAWARGSCSSPGSRGLTPEGGGECWLQSGSWPGRGGTWASWDRSVNPMKGRGKGVVPGLPLLPLLPQIGPFPGTSLKFETALETKRLDPSSVCGDCGWDGISARESDLSGTDLPSPRQVRTLATGCPFAQPRGHASPHRSPRGASARDPGQK